MKNGHVELKHTGIIFQTLLAFFLRLCVREGIGSSICACQIEVQVLWQYIHVALFFYVAFMWLFFFFRKQH